MRTSKKLIFVFSILLCIIAGCINSTSPQPYAVTVIVVTATPLPTDTPYPTLDAAAQATINALYVIPSPTTRAGFPTPADSTISGDTSPDQQTNFSFLELYIGKYVIRRWVDKPHSPYFRYTISTLGQPEIQTPFISEVEPGNGLDPLSGLDITGEGNPDVIFNLYTGGNHCCHSVQMYDLGEKITKIFELGTGDCPGKFIDLNGDGVYEYETCDTTFEFSKIQCSYASSPYPKAIFQYLPEQGYISANLKFANLYEQAIALDSKLIEKYRHTPATALTDTFSICNVSKLVLDYLYSGQTEKGWEVLYQIYPTEKAEIYKAIIEENLQNNPFYEAP